ncbi:FxLD family lanthipeptide [Amycolatopsis aidingensis]|uniref:FxLD family lanthipeptide n=1 Tax=Amycolatopsis aidingensis TaxID=2842453 RepID=UPI001C0B3462
MTTVLTGEPGGVFDLDVRMETERILSEAVACQTEDGCGHTCQISACVSQL